jgi:hypothetical protein
MRRFLDVLKRIFRRRRVEAAPPAPPGGAGPDANDREPNRPLVPVLCGGAALPLPTDGE